VTSGTLPLLAPELEAFRAEFERLSAEAEELLTPLSEEAFNWQPSPGAWSIFQNIEHLNVTARRYLPAMDESIGTSIRLSLYGTGPFVYNWLGRFAVWMMEPPPRVKVKAPADFQPEGPRPARDVLAGFRAYQVQFIDRLHAANGLDLARARLKSPTSSWLRLPLGSGFAMVAAHERRHLWQARQVAALLGYPQPTTA
jgi:hypothetical protein